METPMYDVLQGKKTLIEGLLDGKGSVELVDVSPRLCPEGYGPEYMIVRAARTSFGLGLKDPLTDAKLIRYLIVNYHTSPLEMCNATFRLVVPKDIAVHFLRHRTGKFNQFSQRYAEVKDESYFYDPTLYENGIRSGTKLNKQSSVNIQNEEIMNKIKIKMEEANDSVRHLHKLYSEMIELGLAKEIARFYLPSGEYTTLFCQFDINNLFKMLTLRVDDHSQHETTVYAKAMLEIIAPLFPICVEVFEERMYGMSLMGTEIKVIKGEKEITEIVSISEKASLKEKMNILGQTIPKKEN
jgi:thymidylate synthase (FAD)